MAFGSQAGRGFAFAARSWAVQTVQTGSVLGDSLRLREALLPVSVVLLALLLALPTFVIPLSSDEAYFALGARAILDGEVIYRDLWDLKAPAIYFTYALPFAIGGERLEAIRLLDLFAVFVSMGGVFLLARRLFSVNAGLLAAGFYGFSYFALAGLTGLGEAESFMVAALVFAFVVYGGGRSTGAGYTLAGRDALLAGVLIGVAAAYKFPGALFFLGLPLMEAVFRSGGWSWRAAMGRLGLAVAGMVLVQASWLGYLAAIGALGAYMDIMANYTIPYNDFARANLTPRTLIEATNSWVLAAAFLTVPAWAAAVFAGLQRRWRGFVLVGGLTLLAWFSVALQGKFFDYHWVTVLPFLSILAGYGVAGIAENLKRANQPERLLTFGVLALGFVMLASTPILKTYDGYVALVSRLDGSVSQAELNSSLSPKLAGNHEVVDYIRRHGGPEDGFFIWGFWPQPYLWEDRGLASRFATNAGIRAAWAPIEWRQEMIADLREGRPRFIAVARGDSQPTLTGTSQTSDQHMCESFPELRALVRERYQPVLNNGLFVLYDSQATVAAAPGAC